MRHTLQAALVLGLSGSLGMAATAASAQGTASSGKLDDPTIVAIFDAANTWDMESSGLAVATSHQPGVVTLAKMFVRDHGAVRQQGRDLAKKLGVTPTPPKDFPMVQEHADAMAKLRGLRGAAFDRAYLANEVAYHKEVIDAINSTLLPAIQNPDLKALVVKVAPAFQAHMIAAQQLLDKQPS